VNEHKPSMQSIHNDVSSNVYNNSEKTNKSNLQFNENDNFTKEDLIQIIKLQGENQKIQTKTQETMNKTIEFMSEQFKQSNNSINNSHVNSHNNINIFLNEECKDAINLVDFIKNIQLKIADLEETGRIGFGQNISKILLSEFQGMDYTKRPIHCSDPKREIFYIKNNDNWEKDNQQHDKMQELIKKLGNRNFQQLSAWIKLHPDCMNTESKYYKQYNNIITNCCISNTNEERLQIRKIIRNLCKELKFEKDEPLHL